nr:hypothetical protein [Phaeacidiphilus oryzae]
MHRQHRADVQELLVALLRPVRPEGRPGGGEFRVLHGDPHQLDVAAPDGRLDGLLQRDPLLVQLPALVDGLALLDVEGPGHVVQHHHGPRGGRRPEGVARVGAALGLQARDVHQQDAEQLAGQRGAEDQGRYRHGSLEQDRTGTSGHRGAFGRWGAGR